MEKLWKEIPDTDGKYLISTDGEVMAISRRVNFGNVFRWTKTNIRTAPQKMQAVQPASITIPFQEFAKENQKPLAVIGGDI